MNQSIRSRIRTLNRITVFSAILVATLVIAASHLADSPPPITEASTSAIHNSPQDNTADVSSAALPAAVPTTASTFPIATPEMVDPTATPDVSNRIGILAGHWGYDSGAICEDGLAEVDITTDIAQRVVQQLRARGYAVDLLKEHYPEIPQPPLQGYLAAAFVSIHADSCLPGVSGFKIARWAYSKIPETEDRLVQCLYNEYAAATGLPKHNRSITIDMWNYYAFRELGGPTPGAIIETGFMTEDRWLLVEQPDRAAQGIVNGILCFLENSDKR